MRNLLFLSVMLILLFSFNKKSNLSKEIIIAEDIFKDYGFGFRKLNFRLFSDSTYIFEYN